MTANIERRRNDPSEQEAISSERGDGQAREARASREHRLIMLGIGLEALLNLLRNPRFQRNVITGLIGLAALARLSRESRARSLARLAAWDKKQNLRRQRNAGSRSRG
jgi:hypothetical protein